MSARKRVTKVKEVKRPVTMSRNIPPLVSIPLPAQTTQQQDLTTAGQRRINVIWEYTQAYIAVFVITLALVADAYVAVRGVEIGTNQLAALMQLNVMSGLVIGFYFSRTNHAAIGGIGAKPSQEYEGR